MRHTQDKWIEELNIMKAHRDDLKNVYKRLFIHEPVKFNDMLEYAETKILELEKKIGDSEGDWYEDVALTSIEADHQIPVDLDELTTIYEALDTYIYHNAPCGSIVLANQLLKKIGENVDIIGAEVKLGETRKQLVDDLVDFHTRGGSFNNVGDLVDYLIASGYTPPEVLDE